MKIYINIIIVGFGMFYFNCTKVNFEENMQNLKMEVDDEQKVDEEKEKMSIDFIKSKKFNKRIYKKDNQALGIRQGDKGKIEYLIIHYTACDEEVARNTFKNGSVSTHYMITKSGKIIQFVLEDKRAWHAGKSYWKQNTDINTCSIGIEHVQLGYETGQKDPYDDNLIEIKYRKLKGIGHIWNEWQYPNQINTSIKLINNIISKHNILPHNVLGHSDIANPPGRKVDPGLFPWDDMYKHGIGAWPDTKNFNLPSDIKEPSISYMQDQLYKYGYNIKKTRILDKNTKKVIQMFRLHYYRDEGLISEVTINAMKAIGSLNNKYIDSENWKKDKVYKDVYKI